MVHDPMAPGFSSAFNLILFIVIGGFVWAIGSTLFRTANNLSQPELTRWARIVGRRQNTSGGGGTTGHTTSVSTFYYVTFELEDGSREELSVSGHQYGLLVEGDVGTLQTQGTWFKGFQRGPMGLPRG